MRVSKPKITKNTRQNKGLYSSSQSNETVSVQMMIGSTAKVRSTGYIAEEHGVQDILPSNTRPQHKQETPISYLS